MRVWEVPGLGVRWVVLRGGPSVGTCSTAQGACAAVRGVSRAFARPEQPPGGAGAHAVGPSLLAPALFA